MEVRILLAFFFNELYKFGEISRLAHHLKGLVILPAIVQQECDDEVQCIGRFFLESTSVGQIREEIEGTMNLRETMHNLLAHIVLIRPEDV